MDIPENDLPLFPLNTVLFPQARLPLHIFEARYREMINRCLRDNLAFGVVLIKEGVEVGGAAIPHAVGTLAHIVDVEPLADGRMNIVVKGVARFKLLESFSTRAYMTGRIELLADEVGAGDALVTTHAHAARSFGQFLRTAQAVGSSTDAEPADALTLPDDPTVLSYVIASVLPINNQDKQTLLETPTTAARLSREITLLHREMEILRLVSQPVQRARDQGTFSLN